MSVSDAEAREIDQVNERAELVLAEIRDRSLRRRRRVAPAEAAARCPPAMNPPRTRVANVTREVTGR